MADLLIGLLMPGIPKIQQASDRARQSEHNLWLAFALAAYRQDHGQYPKSLVALAPTVSRQGAD